MTISFDYLIEYACIKVYNKCEDIFIMFTFVFRLDVGEIIAQEQTNIGPDETLPELRARLARIGADTLIETVRKLPSVISNGRPQNQMEATYGKNIIYTFILYMHTCGKCTYIKQTVYFF